VIRTGHSTDSVTTKLERAFVEPVTAAPSVTNALSATTGTLGADRAPATTKAVNRSNATGRCAVATNLASVNARQYALVHDSWNARDVNFDSYTVSRLTFMVNDAISVKKGRSDSTRSTRTDVYLVSVLAEATRVRQPV